YYRGVHHTNPTIDGYMGSGNLIKRAIQKYGRESFTVTVLAEYLTYQDAFEAEQLIIKTHDQDPLSYNIAPGGRGGNLLGEYNPMKNPTISAKVGKATSKRCKGVPLSQQHKDRVSSGLTRSRDQISKNVSANPPSKRFEVAAKISIALMGQKHEPHSTLTKDKLAENARRRISCVKCHKEGAVAPMISRHFSHCLAKV
ncbi:MAG: hypothetical protein ACREQ5_36600, partial [Candidatus Dormibacteria bacterium]